MILELTNEQINYIVNTYGTDKNEVMKIIQILNKLDLPFYDEEDYIVSVCTIVSILETEKFEKEIGKKKRSRACHNLSTAIVSVLEQKFNNEELYDNDTLKKIYLLKNPDRA